MKQLSTGEDRMNKQKKAQFFNVSLVILTVIALSTAFIGLSVKNSKFDDLPVGSKQYGLLMTYIEGEKALQYNG